MPKSIIHWRAWWVIKKKELLNRLSTKKGTHYSKFIILSSGRCGSTLLHTYLNSHTQILSKGEVLRELYDGDKPNAPKEVDAIIFPAQGRHIKSMGLKLFYDYRDMDSFKNAFNALAGDKSIKVIHLVRENKLEQFVSYKRAWRDLEWSANRKKDNDNAKIAIDRQEYQGFVEENERHKKAALEMFAEHEMINLTYEQLTDSNESSLENVQRFLDVPVKTLFTALEKQSDKSLKDVVENWVEVSKVIL